MSSWDDVRSLGLDGDLLGLAMRGALRGGLIGVLMGVAAAAIRAALKEACVGVFDDEVCGELSSNLL